MSLTAAGLIATAISFVAFIILALLLISGTQPTGIAWGYLCHRTRSIWPGAIWHTTGGVLGPIFF